MIAIVTISPKDCIVTVGNKALSMPKNALESFISIFDLALNVVHRNELTVVYSVNPDQLELLETVAFMMEVLGK